MVTDLADSEKLHHKSAVTNSNKTIYTIEPPKAIKNWLLQLLLEKCMRLVLKREDWLKTHKNEAFCHLYPFYHHV